MEYVIIVSLVLLSALFSGLTLGLFSLNKTALERKIKLGDERAKKVYAVRKNGNLLLCTLLLGNAATNATIAIFLGNIASGIIAGLIATGLILVFGEIIPQAVFSRNALNVGSKTAWIVKGLIFIFYPIGAPLAWMLDKMLGEELPTLWSKKEIKEIIRFHEDHPDSIINEDEERIMLGALSFSDKTVYDIMTPKPVVFMLNQETEINEGLINQIREHGHSRIPVYYIHPDTIISILFTKDLLEVIFSKKTFRIKDIIKQEPPIKVKEALHLDQLFNRFVKKKRHMAIVYDEFGAFSGIVTLEDILEEILRIEILDEKDTIADMQQLARKLAAKQSLN